MNARAVERVLVVEDHGRLAETLMIEMRSVGSDVRGAQTVEAARHAVAAWTPQLVILDVALPDGTAFDVLDTLESLEPAPMVIAISGHAGPEESFRLAQRGVLRYVDKPLRLDALRKAIETARRTPPSLAPFLRASVGHRAVKDVEREVRETMVDEAMARADGNRSGAAQLLHISRQLLQHILRK